MSRMAHVAHVAAAIRAQTDTSTLVSPMAVPVLIYHVAHINELCSACE